MVQLKIKCSPDSIPKGYEVRPLVDNSSSANARCFQYVQNEVFHAVLTKCDDKKRFEGLAQTDGCLFGREGRCGLAVPLVDVFTDHGSYAFRKKEKVENYSVSSEANYQIIRKEEGGEFKRLITGGIYLDSLNYVVIANFRDSVEKIVF